MPFDQHPPLVGGDQHKATSTGVHLPLEPIHLVLRELVVGSEELRAGTLRLDRRLLLDPALDASLRLEVDVWHADHNTVLDAIEPVERLRHVALECLVVVALRHRGASTF